MFVGFTCIVVNPSAAGEDVLLVAIVFAIPTLQQLESAEHRDLVNHEVAHVIAMDPAPWSQAPANA